MKLCFTAFYTLIVLLLFTSCKKNSDLDAYNLLEANKIAPDGFNFATFKTVNVKVRLLSNIDEPVKRSMININSSLSGETLLKGLTDDNGYFIASVNIPGYMETLEIDPQNPGLIHKVKGLVINNSLTLVIGGKEGLSGNAIKSPGSGKFIVNNNSRIFSATYTYMGTLDNFGRPLSYLEPQKGTVSADLLSYLGAALPDKQNVSIQHPEFVSDNATEHLNIVQLSDVWITFVAEGAGNKNSIGYYTYETGNPPAQLSDITDIKLLFPNASALGSGGTMESGDKVHIGQFPAGTSIGFVLFAFGWQGGNIVHVDNPKFYSDSRFNPEPSSSLQSHMVLLNFAQENQYIIGFEDLNRTDPTCDHDFNDVILYASSNPVTAISTNGIPTMGPATDTDGDGVFDNNDEFPDDPAKAYTTYYPSQYTKGTLAFEDNWPANGDYDMNDLVIKYRYAYVNNGNNKVVEMTGLYTAVAAFADFKNGFGVQFPFSHTLINNVSGQKHTENYISLNTNGTEAAQTKAVIIPFDNHKTLIQNNIEIIDSVQVKLTFVDPVSLATLGNAPYNPFIIGNKLRGFEIHLPGYLPTDKADLTLLGTKNDDSNPAANKYYLSSQNWPWALSFTESFTCPKEGAAINESYLHFGEWASSGGSLFSDWYSNNAANYRNLSNIY